MIVGAGIQLTHDVNVPTNCHPQGLPVYNVDCRSLRRLLTFAIVVLHLSSESLVTFRGTASAFNCTLKLPTYSN